MENKGLIKEEIKRILEMMNLSEDHSQLLNEGIIDDVVQGLVKIGTKGGTDIPSVIAKLEYEFNLPTGVLEPDDVTKLLSKNVSEELKVLSKIINNMSSEDLTKLVNQTWDQLKTTQNNMDIVINSMRSKGEKVSPKMIDDLAERSIDIKSQGFDKLSQALKKEFRTKMTDKLGDLVETSASSKSDDAASFINKAPLTGTKLYGDILSQLEKSPSWNSLPPDLKRKISKRLENDTIVNPNSSAKELAEKYDEIAYKKLKPSSYKKFKSWIGSKPKVVQYVIWLTIVSTASMFLGGGEKVLKTTVPVIWAFIKEFGQAAYGGVDEFDWNEVVAAWESSGSDGNNSGFEDNDESFKLFIKQDWKDQYTGSETFSREGEYYIVNDGETPFYYKYNPKTKKFDPQS